jgi:predicted nucleic acid-binding protein
VRFADTNVLLYAVSREQAEREKAKRANEILDSRDVAISMQVLQEFYVQATRASRRAPLSHEIAVALIDTFLAFPIQDVTTELVLAALETKRRFGISYWDAAILEASRALGCEVVLSEDFADETDYGGVRVENPFRGL